MLLLLLLLLPDAALAASIAPLDSRNTSAEIPPLLGNGCQ